MLEEPFHRNQTITRRLHADSTSRHDDKDPRLRVAGLGIGPLHELDLTPHVSVRDCSVPIRQDSKCYEDEIGCCVSGGKPNAMQKRQSSATTQK